ncbi:MAG: hypothetical protein H7315_02380 [Herminiimonas sp.]|nr:hypothetical protein [Herminiimonas sp.]
MINPSLSSGFFNAQYPDRQVDLLLCYEVMGDCGVVRFKLSTLINTTLSAAKVLPEPQEPHDAQPLPQDSAGEMEAMPSVVSFHPNCRAIRAQYPATTLRNGLGAYRFPTTKNAHSTMTATIASCIILPPVMPG